MRKEEILREISVKTEQKFYNDLCSTCNHGAICMSKKTRQGPVWFCEEFDNYVPVKEQPWVEAQSQTAINTMEDDCSQFKGLCINCEERHNCHFSKPNGGVWHCEEYK